MPPSLDALLIVFFAIPVAALLDPRAEPEEASLEVNLETPDATLETALPPPPPDETLLATLLATLLTTPAAAFSSLGAALAATLVASWARPRASRVCPSSGMGMARVGTIAKRAARAARPVDTRMMI